MEQQLPEKPNTHSESGTSVRLISEVKTLLDSLPPVGQPLEKMYGRKIICFDFDGTLHQMREWWGPDMCDGDPVPGALEMLDRTYRSGFSVAIYSSRSHQVGGRAAMCAWINRCAFDLCIGSGYNLGDALFYPIFKPPAWLSFDDRTVTAAGERTWAEWTTERLENGLPLTHS